MLLALMLALGPHAADTELHANDPEAAWVRAPMYEMYNSYTSTGRKLVTGGRWSKRLYALARCDGMAMTTLSRP